MIDIGANQTFTFIPNAGSNLFTKLTVDGQEVVAVPSTVIPGAYTYKMQNVTSAHSLAVEFKQGYTISVNSSSSAHGAEVVGFGIKREGCQILSIGKSNSLFFFSTKGDKPRRTSSCS
jgi:hypothetical protein